MIRKLRLSAPHSNISIETNSSEVGPTILHRSKMFSSSKDMIGDMKSSLNSSKIGSEQFEQVNDDELKNTVIEKSNKIQTPRIPGLNLGAIALTENEYGNLNSKTPQCS